MAGGLQVSSDVWGMQSSPEVSPWFSLDTAAEIGADTSYNQPRSSATVPSNALQSMAPVTESGSSLGGWSDFWQSTIKAGVGYAIQKDAVQSGMAPNPTAGGTAAPGYVQAPMNYMPMLLMVVGAGLFVFALKD